MLFKNDSSDSKESLISLHNTSDEETFDYNVHDAMEIAQEYDWMEDKPNIGTNDFVIVKFPTKRSILYYVTRVENTENYNVKFCEKI